MEYSCSDFNKAKAPVNTTKRHSHERILTPFVKSPPKLLVKLLDAKLLKKIHIRQPNQHSKNFDLYAYHFDALDHHTNRCWALKHNIQHLIDEGVLQPKKPSLAICHFDGWLTLPEQRVISWLS